jgi:hypothetical protein
MYSRLPWSCLTFAQAQQQAMYQQATLSCLTGRSSTATGYVPAGYLGAASHGSLKHSNRAMPAGCQTASHGSLKHNRQAVYRGYLEPSRTGQLKHSNGLCASRLPCLTGHQGTATGYVPAGYLGAASHRPAQAQQRAVLPAGWAASHGRSSTATGLCTKATLSALHRSLNTATGYVPAVL